MFYYVELLRAKRAMRIIGIILGIFFLAAAIFRITLVGHHVPNDIAKALESSPTAHVTHATLPDGTLETVVDDPKNRTHAVIDRKAERLHIVISEPTSAYRSQTGDLVDMGSSHDHVTIDGDVARGTLDFKTDAKLDLAELLIISIVFGLITATMLAAPLAKENDGHLELAWTKPVSRESYALASIAVDVAAILLTVILGAITIVLCALLFFVPHLYVSGADGVGLALIAPVAWYALLTAIGASVKRGPGLVIGMGWLGTIIIISFAKATEGAQNALWRMVHVVFQGLSYLNPLAYLTFNDNSWQRNGIVKTLPEAVAVLTLLAVLYIASAVLQWRRVEA